MTINREHFEAWLFSQPKEKVLRYIEGNPDSETGCLVCNYLRDNYEKLNFVVTGYFIDINGSYYPFVDWLNNLLNALLRLKRGLGSTFTIAEAQAEYLKLFPDTVVSNFETNPALSAQAT